MIEFGESVGGIVWPRFVLGCAGAAVGLAGQVVAQEQPWALPNPLRGQNVVATCDNWPAQKQASDPRAMQAIAGVWEGMGMIPGTPGIMADTPYQFRSTVAPNGQFAVDRYGCFTMQSVPGMPPLGQSCATSQIYGEWVAHFTQDGAVAMVTLSSGSSFTGQALPISCGVAFYRLVDQNTMVDQGGNQLRRAGN